jgi:hypothetical protein
MATNTLKKTAADWRWWLLVGGAVVGAALWLAFLRDVLRGPLPSIPLNASTTALLIFVAGTVLLLIGARIWLTRIDHHALLRADERLQNKDALVIGAFFTVVMLFGFCITGATAAWRFPDRAGEAVTLALGWALASASVGGAFGFLLGHPRRLASDEKGKEERTTLGGLLRTGLDDMVDWLVKGLTTVLLVNSAAILAHLHTLSSGFAKGLLPPASPEADVVAAQSFAQPVIVFFTIFGALAACLVTRTYLTGALGRADRSSTGAFNRIGLEVGEVLMLQAAQRSLATREVEPSPEIANVASKLAALSITEHARASGVRPVGKSQFDGRQHLAGAERL